MGSKEVKSRCREKGIMNRWKKGRKGMNKEVGRALESGGGRKEEWMVERKEKSTWDRGMEGG